MKKGERERERERERESSTSRQKYRVFRKKEIKEEKRKKYRGERTERNFPVKSSRSTFVERREVPEIAGAHWERKVKERRGGIQRRKRESV